MKFVEIFMPNKILIFKNKKIKKILKINVEATCGIKNLTLYIYYWFLSYSKLQIIFLLGSTLSCGNIFHFSFFKKKKQIIFLSYSKFQIICNNRFSPKKNVVIIDLIKGKLININGVYFILI